MNLFIASTAKENVNQDLLKEVSNLINEIAKIPKVNLVFGAYHKGLMKVSYDAFSNNKKDIIGVITEYDKKNCKNEKYTKEIVVKTSTERFQKIFSESDLLLLLPGGIGTLSELFSSIEERKNGVKKKIIIYNYKFFFTPILEELYNLYREGFIDEPPAEYMIIESDKEKILSMIKEEI